MERYECNLRPDLLEKAVAELNEPRDNAERLNAIDQLRDNFNIEKYGQLIRSDDAFLLRFLRSRKFNQSKALMVLQNYHTIRKNFREVFSLVENPESLRGVMDSGIMYAIEGKAQAGENVIIYRPGMLSKNVTMYQVIAYGVICVEELLEDEEYQICGSITVDDLDEFNLRTLMQVSLSGARRMNQVWQDAMPVRIRSIYIFNEGRVFDIIFTLFKPFMKNKMKKRIQLHGSNYKALHSEVDPSLLPPCLLGTGPEMIVGVKEWVERLQRKW